MVYRGGYSQPHETFKTKRRIGQLAECLAGPNPPGLPVRRTPTLKPTDQVTVLEEFLTAELREVRPRNLMSEEELKPMRMRK